jgi:TRAP-type mannitol/chloroaromatic compound transport system permease large subunit
MIFVFFLAFFLDFFEISFIVVPLLLPAAHALDVNMVWFGLLLCVNIQTSFMHPPFGFALFYLRGIAPPEVKSRDIYWGAIPWIGLQLLLAGVLVFWPESVTYWIGEHKVLDQGAIERALEDIPMPDAGGDLALPPLDLSPPDLSQPPNP